jgi:WD40 repeat protein
MLLIERLSGPTGRASQVVDRTFTVSGEYAFYNPPALAVSSYGNIETVAVATSSGMLLGRFGGSQSGYVSSYPPSQELRPYVGWDEGFSYIALNSNGTVLAAADDDGLLHIWNVRSGRAEKLVSPLETSNYGPIAFGPNGRTLAIADGGESGNDVETWPAAPG